MKTTTKKQSAFNYQLISILNYQGKVTEQVISQHKTLSAAKSMKKINESCNHKYNTYKIIPKN